MSRTTYNEGKRAALAAPLLAADPPDTYVDRRLDRVDFMRGWVDGRALLAMPTVKPNPTRAAHVGIRPDGMAHGAPRPTDAPDPYVGVRHDVQLKRSRKAGTSAIVRRRGTVRPVVGSWVWDDAAPLSGESQTDPRMALAMFLNRTQDDQTGLYLQRAADAILGDSVPKLLGTDAVSWEQVIRHEHGRAADTSYAPVATHVHLYDAVDVTDRHGRDVYVTSHLPGTSRLHRVTRRQMAETSRGGVTARVSRVGDRRARVRLPYRLRKSDLALARDLGPADVRDCAAVGAFGGAALVAPRDASTVWVGHAVAQRTQTTRAKRAQRSAVKVARTVEHFDICAPSVLADVIAQLGRGQRATWTLGTITGTVTRGTSGKLAYTARSGRATIARAGGLRTADAVVRQLAHALS